MEQQRSIFTVWSRDWSPKWKLFWDVWKVGFFILLVWFLKQICAKHFKGIDTVSKYAFAFLQIRDLLQMERICSNGEQIHSSQSGLVFRFAVLERNQEVTKVVALVWRKIYNTPAIKLNLTSCVYECSFYYSRERISCSQRNMWLFEHLFVI